MTDDHRDRRVAESSKLQALINDLSKVPPARRMYLVHDEIMHAIDASLRTHKGHKFEVAEIELIRDVAFAIVYTLDPSNRPARGFFADLWRDFKALGAMQRIAAVGAVILFLLGAIGGSITVWEKMIRPIVAAERVQPAEPASPIPANKQQGGR
jgi:hypothetical protein